MPQTSRIRITYQDYLHFPEDGRRHELIDGDHLMTPAPSTRHQRIVGRLYRILSDHAERTQAGEVFVAPTDVVLSETDVVQPDLLFIRAARAETIAEKHILGAPDLIVEVLLESTRRTDLLIKRQAYERHRVPEYWIVDPEVDSVTVYHWTGQDYSRAAELSLERGESLTTSLLPGLQIQLSRLFA